MAYIKLEDLQKFPIRLDHYDKENGNEHFIFGIETVIEYAENLPTADVVEVVRCSECKYAVEVEYMGCACKNEKTPWCNDEFEVYMNPTDFCSYGEGRTDDGNL